VGDSLGSEPGEPGAQEPRAAKLKMASFDQLQGLGLGVSLYFQ
jgi:hypothetical protein